ncbi:TPA: hypothetical protein PXI74_004465 [Yersinia enterocolitica]|nr:hypothetical protein [Yersinia enterocolitica]HDL6775022.1 hypothetical protein [Yersinia enterocolitica]HDL8291395.1 hypothetical protein [Yersinia enterocolitica]HEM6608190.1 hypothetical protein [Yersinia enterocolitica]HEN3517282.1 hypothetical protein [Yersinia enterocolitica]
MSEIKQYDTEVRLEAVMGTNHYGQCHFSECRQPIARGLFCDAGCRDDYEIDERRKGMAA